jgi:phage terminase large subunit
MARRTATRAMQTPAPSGQQTIVLPRLYTPRSYQQPAIAAMDAGVLRAITVWHRRAGKDLTWLNVTIKAMVRRPGVYYHVFPTYAQGKRVLWDGQDNDGIKYLDRFPPELVLAKNETELQVRMVVGTDAQTGDALESVWQIIGADKPDSVRGPNPMGVVFSEYSVMDGAYLWDLFRPILTANNGWAAFAFTPLGQNHAHQLFETAQRANEQADRERVPRRWFVQVLTVDDTRKDACDAQGRALPGEDGTAVMPRARIDDERADGMPEELVQQEYYCAWSGFMEGAYYARQLSDAENSGRIGLSPYDARLPVETAWDIGRGDKTAIWFVQVNGPAVRLIDYYEADGEGLLHYIHVVKERKPYLYRRHYGPHDLEVADWVTNKPRAEMAKAHGVKFTIVPKWTIDEGIDAVRRLFPRLYLDREACRVGLDHLKHYRRLWDAKRKAYKDEPYHDVHSNAADALRYLAIGLREARPDDTPATGARAELAFNPYEYDRVGLAETAFNPLHDEGPAPASPGWWAIQQQRLGARGRF